MRTADQYMELLVNAQRDAMDSQEALQSLFYSVSALSPSRPDCAPIQKAMVEVDEIIKRLAKIREWWEG